MYLSTPYSICFLTPVPGPAEVAALDLDYFDPQQKTLAILGKGGALRMITLWPKTVDLLSRYVEKYRITPHTIYRNRLFLNQRGKELTRHGIYRLCRKYLEKVLPEKRLKTSILPPFSSCLRSQYASDRSSHIRHKKPPRP